ncbi:MAG TPA: SDR family oxidoreductase [Mobilitalea sp.]|nr:SDR family oxidoreductase [Mobilitalea sp.]
MFMKRVCIVTGGANGIGLRITERFIEEGDFVAVIDVDKKAGNILTGRFPAESLMFYHGDITDPKVIENFVSELLKLHPAVDIIINNACVGKGGLNTCSYDDFNYVLRLGVSAPFYLTKLLMPHLNPNASIVNIASTRAFMSQPDTESYTAAKGGIISLTHGMSITLAGRARVNSISPGWIDTGHLPYSDVDHVQHPAGRIGVPDDIADMVLYLCSEKAGFITGQNFTVDGGMTKQMIYHGDYGWFYQNN